MSKTIRNPFYSETKPPRFSILKHMYLENDVLKNNVKKGSKKPIYRDQDLPKGNPYKEKR